jgi:ubiquinone/menaquinone biosynthesis C-methylase UbiE
MFRALRRKVYRRVRNRLAAYSNLSSQSANAPSEGVRKFIPDPDQWISSHYYDVVNEAVAFCGNIFRESSILNVGCGEMLTDFGFLRFKPNSVTGLDISPQPEGHLNDMANRLRKHGIEVSENDHSKLKFVQYDGKKFPFPDQQYDTVFSWSAFEHVQDIDGVLSEIHRVLKPGGKAFIQVYPWYNCRYGSHLSDWIDEPYFHLRRTDDWVLSQLEIRAASDTENKDFILAHMWPEYRSLNRISPRDFYRSVLGAGFKVLKARMISHDEDLSLAPPDADFADLMIAGTMMLLSKP